MSAGVEATGTEAASTRGFAQRLRTLARGRETSLVVLAALIGVLAGLSVTLISRGAELLHSVLFGAARISSIPRLPLHVLLWPAIGGLIMGGVILALKRWRPHSIVDPIEANALHGGRMSHVF